MSPQARTPDWVRQQPKFAAAKEAMEAAQHASTRATEVTDETTCARAAEILVQVKNARKAIDKNRLAAGEPYRKSQTAINNEYKELDGALSGIEERLAVEVEEYEELQRQAEAERRRQYDEEVRQREEAERAAAAKRVADEEAAARAAKAAEEAGAAPPPAPEPAPPPAPAPPPPPPPPPERGSVVRQTSGGSVGSRLEWTFDVEEPEEVPDKYKKIEYSSIGKDVRAGAREIPGVRIYQKRILTSRTKRS